MRIMANIRPVAFVVRGLTGILVLFALWGALAARDTLAADASACRLNSDCPTGWRCASRTGACTPLGPPPEGSCYTDQNCAPNEVCTGQQCVTRECRRDAQCPLGEVCDQGLCKIDTSADRDRDGVPDGVDNCQEVANAGQEDSDGDGRGDTCDEDDDGDGVLDTADNCPLVANPGQEDSDNDGIGNACDSDDRDADGIPDWRDNCPLASNPDQSDLDGDGQGSRCDLDQDGDGLQDGVSATAPDGTAFVDHSVPSDDNCPTVPNHWQIDTNYNHIGDACEALVLSGPSDREQDRDGDGIRDTEDNCGLDPVQPGNLYPNPDQADRDGDGFGDICDPDPDGDGVGMDPHRYSAALKPGADGEAVQVLRYYASLDPDNCPFVFNPDQADLDGDGIGDACDPLVDRDSDGIRDSADNCPLQGNADQADRDHDGIGDACDLCPDEAAVRHFDSDGDGIGDLCDRDKDGDGALNFEDNCPGVANADQADADQDGYGDVCDR